MYAEFFQDDKFGKTHSKKDGSFALSGSAREIGGKPNPFIQIVYDYEETYMKVVGLAGITRKYDTDIILEYTKNLNFGNIMIADDHCRALLCCIS